MSEAPNVRGSILIDGVKYQLVRIGAVPPWMERYGTVLCPPDYPDDYDHWTETQGGSPVNGQVPVYAMVTDLVDQAQRVGRDR